MSRRLLPSLPPALPLSLALLCVTTPPAQAHKLGGWFHVLPGPKVQIECWFSATQVPSGAKVSVYRANGELLFSPPGVLDEKGVYQFAVEKIEPLKVVISAGAGHSVTLEISTKDLDNPTPLSERTVGYDIKDVLIGVTFILALAAFVLSVLCLQRLRKLSSSGKGAPDEHTTPR